MPKLNINKLDIEVVKEKKNKPKKLKQKREK